MGSGRVTARSRRQQTHFHHYLRSISWAAVCIIAPVFAIFALTLPVEATGPSTNGRFVDPGELLQIMNQTSFVAADGMLTIDIGIALDDLAATPLQDTASTEGDTGLQPASPLDRFTIDVTVFGRISDEADVEQPPTRPLNRVDPIPLSTLPTIVDGIGRELYRVELPVRSGEPFDGRERVLIPEPGVYPITVELHDSNGLLATRRTHFIRLAQETSGEATVAPIPVAVLLPVTAADGLTLEDAIQLLTAHPNHPMTVSLQEGTQSQLRSDPELATRFQAAVGQRQVIASSFLDLDPSALAEIGQEPIYGNAVTTGRQGYEASGIVISPAMTEINTPLTEQGVRALQSVGVQTVITKQPGGNGYFTVDNKRLHVISIDEDPSSTFSTEDSGPVVATQVLAKLVLRGETNRAAVVLGGPSLGERPVPAINAFLVALSQPGAPQPIAVADIEQDIALQVAERPSQDLGPVSALLFGIQNSIATYESSYRAGGTPPQQFRNRMLASLSRTRNQQERKAALDLLAQQIDEELNVISLPASQPVNLAARSAPIPLVVESNAKGPRLVMVKFVSDKVSVSLNEQVILVEPGTSSVDVEVEARSLGVSPLEVSIWTPDGKEQLALTTFQVRSTAVPGVGLLLSAIGIVMLCSWWWVDNRRRSNERIHAKAASIALSME